MKSVISIIILNICTITVHMFNISYPDTINQTTIDRIKELSTTSDYSTDIFVQTDRQTYDSSNTSTTNIMKEYNPICTRCYCNSKTKVLNCQNGTQVLYWLNDKLLILLNKEFSLEKIIISDGIRKIPILPSLGTRNLILQNNRIDSIESGAFKNLKYLQELDLSYNQLTASALTSKTFCGVYHPYEYDEFEYLTILNLAYNQINSLDADLFDYLPNLNILNLSGNPFISMDFATISAIKSITQLQELNLSNMKLFQLSSDLFENSIGLQVLDVSGNYFTLIPEALRSAKNLTNLNLNNNPIKVFDVKNSFPEFTNLHTLSISNMNELISIEKHSFRYLSLRSLNCSNNPKLSKFDMEAFLFARGKPDLRTRSNIQLNASFYLNNNNLTTIMNLNSIAHWWTRFGKIDLRYNPWDCSCDNIIKFISLLKILSENNPVVDIPCNNPQFMDGIPVADLMYIKYNPCERNRYDPEENIPHHANPIIIAIGSGVGGLIAVLLALLLIYKCGFLKCRQSVTISNITPAYERIE